MTAHWAQTVLKTPGLMGEPTRHGGIGHGDLDCCTRDGSRMEPVGCWVLLLKQLQKNREREKGAKKENAKIKPLADQFSAEGRWKAGGFALY